MALSASDQEKMQSAVKDIMRDLVSSITEAFQNGQKFLLVPIQGLPIDAFTILIVRIANEKNISNLQHIPGGKGAGSFLLTLS